MNNFVFELDKKGVRDMLKSSMVGDCLRTIAKNKVSGLSGNYQILNKTSQTRVYIVIRPEDKKTYFRNLHNNELIKGVGV